MYRVIVLFLLFSGICFGQDQDILLTINEEGISTTEFLNSFKKNREIITASQKTSPATYLEVFIDYKLKIQEAVAQGYADDSKYKEELKKYRNQLAEKFIKDTKVTDDLIKEAYDRIVYEVNARHILVKIGNESDTLSAYNRIFNARQRIIDGEEFNKVAREMSEDPSVKKNGGELGWFSAFKMVYPFETAAYNTEINDISLPFKTTFGYHIVEPTAIRKSLGSITVAHIMIAHDQPDSAIAADQQILQIYSQLKNGGDFSDLAKLYSDDKSSSKKGGKLSAFEQGQLRSKKFEKEAFKLKRKNEYSKPFRTDFGWHVIQLLKRSPVKSFEESKKELVERVTRDTRSRVIDQTLFNKLRQRYNVKGNEELVSFLHQFVKNKKLHLSNEEVDRTAFIIKDRKYSYGEVFDYLRSRYEAIDDLHKDNKMVLKREINRFVNSSLKKYYLENLENEHSDFKMILKEYEEGLLLFEFLEHQIWDKAVKDSTGLQKYFENHLDQYTSKDLNEVKGKVVSDYQKDLEQNMVKRLRANANIKIENEILSQISTPYENK
ncbi:peptidylprolyl isomerase [Dokdonia sp. Hel_I_53]|uniref:peptidylprolyl isomerase n=1 Tax=Dokdonia sp. Hel_I_53 TaxID=1566287 RepID=UPI001199B039|nr:peptidylprolyl isomerase [Dokdonia sp. Hel_I_53]TVZ51274.1 peptidyl-prolyl cis-trans isomerase SurA [Dokdonia sp. Hel_I_53]